MSEWKKVRLGNLIQSFDSLRKPLSSIQRAQFQGPYRYYGAQEVIDYVRDYIFDGSYILMAEDGENLLSRKKPIAQIVSGKFWVNNHAHIFKANNLCDQLFLYYSLNYEDITHYITGSAQPKLSKENLNSILISLPPLPTQRKIAAVLSSLDDKIENNRKICANLEAQAQAIFKSWFVDFEPFGGKMPQGWKILPLESVCFNIRERVGSDGGNERKVLSAIADGKLVLSEEYFSKQVYSKDVGKYIIVNEGDFAYNPARINIGSIGINDLGVNGCVSPVYVSIRVDKEYRNFFKLFFKTPYFAE